MCGCVCCGQDLSCDQRSQYLSPDILCSAHVRTAYVECPNWSGLAWPDFVAHCMALRSLSACAPFPADVARSATLPIRGTIAFRAASMPLASDARTMVLLRTLAGFTGRSHGRCCWFAVGASQCLCMFLRLGRPVVCRRISVGVAMGAGLFPPVSRATTQNAGVGRHPKLALALRRRLSCVVGSFGMRGSDAHVN